VVKALGPCCAHLRFVRPPRFAANHFPTQTLYTICSPRYYGTFHCSAAQHGYFYEEYSGALQSNLSGSNCVFSNGVAQYNRLSQVTRESKTVAAFRKNLRKKIEARNYICWCWFIHETWWVGGVLLVAVISRRQTTTTTTTTYYYFFIEEPLWKIARFASETELLNYETGVVQCQVS